MQAFITIVAYANTKTGYDAEDALLISMRERYGMNRLNPDVIIGNYGGEYEASKDR